MHKIGPMEDLLVARNQIVFRVYHDHFEYYACTDQESMGAGGRPTLKHRPRPPTVNPLPPPPLPPHRLMGDVSESIVTALFELN